MPATAPFRSRTKLSRNSQESSGKLAAFRAGYQWYSPGDTLLDAQRAGREYSTSLGAWGNEAGEITLQFISGWKSAEKEYPKGKRNPSGSAARMFEKFHGKPSEGIIEIEREEVYHGNLAQLGILVGLHVRRINGRDISVMFDTAGEVAANSLFGSWVRVGSYKTSVQAEKAAAKLDTKGVRAKVEKKDITKGFSILKKYRFDVLADKTQYRALLRGGPKAPKGTVSESVIYKGYEIAKDGKEFMVPQLDSSRFEDLRQAKRFVDAQKNPRISTFVELIMERGGLNRKDAQRAIATLKRVKAIKADVVTGDYRIKHGAFLDRDVLQRAAKENPGPFSEAAALIGKGSSYIAEKGPLGAAYKTGRGVLKFADRKLGKALKGNPGYGPVLLTSNEDGTQLYLEGGDQSLDLEALKIQPKDSVVVGQAWAICYRTRKSFDDFKDIDYVHGFGEEKAHPRLSKRADLWEDAKPPEKLFGTGDLPTLRYDCLNGTLHLDGGVYVITKPMIGVSPGIEN